MLTLLTVFTWAYSYTCNAQQYVSRRLTTLTYIIMVYLCQWADYHHYLTSLIPSPLKVSSTTSLQFSLVVASHLSRCRYSCSWLSPRLTTRECIRETICRMAGLHSWSRLYHESSHHCSAINWWIARRLCERLHSWAQRISTLDKTHLYT